MSLSGNSRVSHYAEPANEGLAVVTSDNTDITNYDQWRGVYVGVSGDIVLNDWNDVTLTFKSVPVGFFPFRPKRIKTTGTTATNMNLVK
jgi:hypothetical protein